MQSKSSPRVAFGGAYSGAENWHYSKRDQAPIAKGVSKPKRPTSARLRKSYVSNVDHFRKEGAPALAQCSPTEPTRRKRPQTAKARSSTFLKTSSRHSNYLRLPIEERKAMLLERKDIVLERYEEFDRWCQGFEADLQEFRSVALLCKLKMDQANLISGGSKKPDRIRAAMACICLEKVCESLQPQYSEIINSLMDQLTDSIFCTKNDGSSTLQPPERPWTGADMLRHKRVGTYFEKAAALEKENAHLAKQLQDKKDYIDKIQQYISESKHIGAMRFMKELKAAKKRDSFFQATKGLDKKVVLAEADTVLSLESLVSEYNSLDSVNQEKALQALSFQSRNPPSAALALSIYHQIPPADRKSFLKIAISNLNSLDVHSNWFVNSVQRANSKSPIPTDIDSG